MTKPKKIVVLGAGYGGILTAKKIAKKLKKTNHEITIIDKNSYHTMLTELHEVAANRVPESAIRINLKKIFAKRNVKVTLDEIQNIDFKNKILKGKNQEYSFDYLVIGTGSRPTFFNIPGANEYAYTLWSFDDAVITKNRILDMFRKASVESDPIKRKRMLSFVIAGSGFTGVEMAGELGEWKDELCDIYSINKDEVAITLVDMQPHILPLFDMKLVKKANKRLKKLNVNILTNTKINKLHENYVGINDDEKIDTNTIIWAAGTEGSQLVENIDINKEARNRISCNSYLQTTDHENVYVVGDNILYTPDDEEKPVPQMVENAEHSAGLVSKNIVSSIKGETLKEYKPNFHGAMVCVGGKYGVAQLETKNKKYHFSGFIAMFIKHFINIIYFLQVAGFNKIWSYMIHEFFHVRNKRSFVGGHFSKRSPNFWIVPLRLFLGGMWLYEGLQKLPSVLEDPNNIFLIPASDLISGASEAWEGSEAATEVALAVPDFISNIVDWSMNLVFYNPDGSFTIMAAIFQTIMVGGEIIVGLCLIGGLFTALASIGSILMGLMIWSSGMAPFEMLWYIIGSFATIGGSGSTFGMDYYVLPWLKKKWKKFKFAKKWYLYTD